ncbi:MAG: hypothetical protein JWO47_193 [Candidatus Saccharibacteria bacterium]|nr:hypothetical protein [Candidatus Saccharibacteria bacterium]
MALLRSKTSASAPASSAAPVVDTSHIAQEVYRKNVELAHTNQTLSLLRTIDNLVLESQTGLDTLTKGVADAVIANSNYPFSAIFLRPRDELKVPMVLKGFKTQVTPENFDMASFNMVEACAVAGWADSVSQCVVIDLLATDKTVLNATFKKEAPKVLDLAKKLQCQALCFIKLLARKDLVGLLVVGVAQAASTIKLEDLEHIGRIGEAVGIAIDNKLLFEENQAVLKKLKQSNQKLKALDEAKDEFISMASHQLRTPLTSVKGYVSMVLEGDVGKVSSQQREMLEQAFASSQRMVYLIADLLNVSRLKTGKFVIETAPTYLPDVVETEMKQLLESAKARNLELIFDRPAEFPMLNLDETKTRQVIMNFMDNAIYYTPAGGHIRVELLATDKVVEYKVVDDGLGVPKAEMAHLFTKFYRAGNAKKARPDGTGLGLFMAKKVVIAQGGSIIFESEENKGSTFGFSFPRAALEVKKTS